MDSTFDSVGCIPVFVGSSGMKTCLWIPKTKTSKYSPLAQRSRAPSLQGGCRWFESSRGYLVQISYNLLDMAVFEVDFSDYTIYRLSSDGTRKDLNEYGYPVSTLSGLRNLADDLYDCGAYDSGVRASIVQEIDERARTLGHNVQ